MLLMVTLCYAAIMQGSHHPHIAGSKVAVLAVGCNAPMRIVIASDAKSSVSDGLF
jgi:hypothetical protein